MTQYRITAIVEKFYSHIKKYPRTTGHVHCVTYEK